MSPVESPTVATYPSAGVRKGPLEWAKGASSIEGKCMESPSTFIQEKCYKNQKDKGQRILKMKVPELFTHGEGISTPHARHKERQPIIECANHDFKTMYFPFLCYLFPFLCFFYFFGVDKGIDINRAKVV